MEKGQKTVDYEFVVRTLGLHPDSSFYYFDLKTNGALFEGCYERSVMLRDAVLVWICTSGSVVASVGGLTHTLQCGQMLVVFAGTYCRFTSATPDFRCATIIGRVYAGSTAESIITTFPRVRQMPVVQLLRQEEDTLLALMDYINQTSVNPRNTSRSEIDSNIMSILRGELMDIFLRRNMSVKESSQDEQLVKKFNMMLSVSCFEHRDVEYYAAECDLTPKRFAAKVKRITGSTPSDLIASAVIKNAKRLLLSTDLSSTEIASKLNFSTPSFFCRYFKRYAGVSPQEWKARNIHL